MLSVRSLQSQSQHRISLNDQHGILDRDFGLLGLPKRIDYMGADSRVCLDHFGSVDGSEIIEKVGSDVKHSQDHYLDLTIIPRHN